MFADGPTGPSLRDRGDNGNLPGGKHGPGLGADGSNSYLAPAFGGRSGGEEEEAVF